MKILKKNDTETKIEVGDIVNYVETDHFCILSYNPENKIYPYQLVRLQTGEIVNRIGSIEYVNAVCELVAKNKNVVLSY